MRHVRIPLLLLPALLLVIAGCDAAAGSRPQASPSAQLQASNPVLAVRLYVDGSEYTQAGVSLGGNLAATYYSWAGEQPEDLRAEVMTIDGTTYEANIEKADRELKILLLKTAAGELPDPGAMGSIDVGNEVYLIGLEEASVQPEATPPATGAQDPLDLREERGEITGVAVSLPDPRALEPAQAPEAGPFVEVSAPGWNGLSGGLVTDAEKRPAGLVVLVQIMTSGASGSSYALPLEEIEQWAVE